MCILFKKCCCCLDLRLGSILWAVLTIVVNCGFFGTKPNLCNFVFCFEAFYVLVAGSTIGIVGSLCLLIGAIMSNKLSTILISIYLIFDGIRMILYIAFGGWSFDIYGKCMGDQVGVVAALLGGNCILVLVGAIFGMVYALVSIYFWLCTFSFLQKIRHEGS